MHKILLIILFSGVSKFCLATSIVIYVTPDFVIMATDSRGVFTNAKTYQQNNKVVSKIYKSGDTYFSLAGLTSNPAKSFDVGKITNAGLRNAADLTAGIEAIKTNVKQALLTYLRNQKKNNAKLFKQNVESAVYITSVGIISIQDNKPYAHLLGFKVVDGREIRVTVEEEIYDQKNRDAVYYLGSSGAINDYMKTINRNTLEPVAFVEKLINLQIRQTPQEVGPPIDILKLTPDTTIWVRKKELTPIELN